MSRVEKFEDLIAWQKARILTREVYAVTRKGAFARDYGLAGQMQRSSVSIMSNIAEGYERSSLSEYHQFLVVAKASCAELRAQLYVALDAGYLDHATFAGLMAQAEEVGRIIGGLRASIARRRDAISEEQAAYHTSSSPAPGLSPPPSPLAPHPSPLCVEWNAHMFSRDTARFPFHPQAAYLPDAARLSPDPLADYQARMAQEGIDRAVLVHPEPYGDDHRLILDCLQREPDLFRGVCLFYPKDPDAPAKLEALVRQEPRIVALRFHAHRGKEMYLDSFDDAGVRALWAKAADLSLIVELHIGPNYARQAARRIAEYPDVPVLVDHLGEPQFGTPVEYADVLDLARYDNVTMKISGVEYVSRDAPLCLDVQPFVCRVAEEFGPDRLAWGSGAPRLVDAHLAHWSEADRAKVKGGNVARLLGF